MKKQPNIQEEEIKGRIRESIFKKFDCTVILGRLDFTVKDKATKDDREHGYYLWAESKKARSNLVETLTQAVMTVGRERTFNSFNPPPFIGGFDNENIMFVPYHKVSDIFYLSDFNWNVPPSDHTTKEFIQVYERVKSVVENDREWQGYCFNYEHDAKDLAEFVKANFVPGKAETTKVQIDTNSFTHIFDRWLKTVKDTIDFNWKDYPDVIPADFYLADLFSRDNVTLGTNLNVLLKTDRYELAVVTEKRRLFDPISFKDDQRSHSRFWSKYERPPAENFREYIRLRRELLVPQDVRERKGSFYTPAIWTALSQSYIAKSLGENWQDEYYVWDCAAGTGNLLAGLKDKYRIWASTLDQADVDIMRERIQNGAALLEDHVFQFDFLNDDFSKLPKDLLEIITDPKKRKKLVIYINPPYAQAGSRTTISKTGKNKDGVAPSKLQAIAKDSDSITGTLENEARELYIHFLMRIITKISGCVLAEFSTLKTLQAPVFERFRYIFNSKLLNMFVVPANTFDNVTGEFPIGFKIWDTGIKDVFHSIEAKVFNHQGELHLVREFVAYARQENITSWISKYKIPKTKKKSLKDKGKTKFELEEDFMRQNNIIGWLQGVGRTAVQNYNLVYITNKKKSSFSAARGAWINKMNLMEICTFFSIWKCIDANWINDCDHFLAPNQNYYYDMNFQLNCFVFALFTNAVSFLDGTNHWIPFTHNEVDAKKKFESNFMSEFIKTIFQGESKSLFPDAFLTEEDDLNSDSTLRSIDQCLEFSSEAKVVFNAGLRIWQYYHSKSRINVNASLYDIRLHFNKRNDQGRMNTISDDEIFNELDTALRAALKVLAQKIVPKVYEYQFLRG